MARKKTVSDEELYKLKEQRMTYKEISQYFAARGIKISERQVGRRISKIYEDMNEEVTRGSRISDEELYQLKERGLIYRQMVEYFEGIGIEISERAIIKRVKKIYTNRNKKIPKGKQISDKELHELIEERKKNQEKYKVSKKMPKKHKKKLPSDYLLYRLKKQGLSYADIVEYLASEKGITICLRAVAIRTKKIFDAKGEKVPIAKRKISNEPRVKRKNRSRGRMQVSDQELYKLKQTCMSDSAISKYLERKGIKLCPSAIRVRIKEIYSERGEKIPRGRKGIIYTPLQKSKLIEAIGNLKITRNASDEQINEIAELYGVNLKRKVIRRACDRFRILRD